MEQRIAPDTGRIGGRKAAQIACCLICRMGKSSGTIYRENLCAKLEAKKTLILYPPVGTNPLLPIKALKALRLVSLYSSKILAGSKPGIIMSTTLLASIRRDGKRWRKMAAKARVPLFEFIIDSAGGIDERVVPEIRFLIGRPIAHRHP